MQPPMVCPYCKNPIQETFIFCPTCGVKISDIHTGISVGKQIGIYALSIFLPPLGLIPGLKYIFGKNEKVKVVGIVAVILTILSTVITILYTFSILNQVTKVVSTQSTQYQNLGL